MPGLPLARKRPRDLDPRKRPRFLKSPQGVPTMPLFVRIADAAYEYLEREALLHNLSKARMLSRILLEKRNGQPF